MSDRKSVRAELERKRIQLAQMRQERERRSRMLQDENLNPTNPDGHQDKLDDADAVLHALGLSASLSRASTAPSNVSSLDQSRLHAQSPDTGSTVSQQQQQQQQISQQQSSQQFSTSLNDSFSLQAQQQQSTPKAVVPLQVVHVNQINIPPKERVYYTKSTQTPAPINVPPQLPSESGGVASQGDAPQKSYYGKQHKSQPQTPNAIPSSLQHNSTGESTPQSPSASNSLSNNTQVAGVNQLALEWDDEFPGMFRLVHCKMAHLSSRATY